MSDLNTSFTFRLTHEDKAALADLAERLGCDRGAVLRRMIRQSSIDLGNNGNGLFAANGRTFQLRLQPVERVE
ncbi:MAG TPA: ribbon-helix-helix protein, CopG family [Bellilinea sp.]|mgnify:CR=1 FL=1|nr:ribbon-helix-helix protein, CopG family [Bellilinea sp.]